MKHTLIFMLLISLYPSLVSADNNVNPNKQSKYIFHTCLSLGFVNGGAIGVGKIREYESNTIENSINLNYHECHYFYSTGFYYQINSFKNKRREGFFWLLKGGMDYTKGKSLIYYNIGGDNDKNTPGYKGVFPHIAVGMGYSFRLTEKSNMRVSWDLGIKKSVSNISLFFCF